MKTIYAIEEDKYGLDLSLVNKSLQRSAMADVLKVIGVVGGGQMGSGIAQLAAVAGFNVWLHDADPSALARATQLISSSIARFVSKGQLSQVFNSCPFPSTFSFFG